MSRIAKTNNGPPNVFLLMERGERSRFDKVGRRALPVMMMDPTFGLLAWPLL